MPDVFPANISARNKWVLDHRPARNLLDPRKPYGCFVEDELAEDGRVVRVATVMLTNRECPWRCVMCDLWRNTLLETVPSGAISAQIRFALNRLGPASQIKLYNSGSFFDPGAIPPADFSQIAATVGAFDRVIVECHPVLIDESCLRFRDLICGKLEVAMGLETVHPEALDRLNKRMTVEQFAEASAFLRKSGIALRAFVLVGPPFVPPQESQLWVRRTVDFAFDCGATAVSLIATRAGNGAMEALAAQGQFTPPALTWVEAAAHYAIGCRRGRAFVDLWDIDRIAICRQCAPARIERLRQMNLAQTISPGPPCESCGA
jgi:radical SAM enzyme (TIGR01210 family)